MPNEENSTNSLNQHHQAEETCDASQLSVGSRYRCIQSAELQQVLVDQEEYVSKMHSGCALASVRVGGAAQGLGAQIHSREATKSRRPSLLQRK